MTSSAPAGAAGGGPAGSRPELPWVVRLELRSRDFDEDVAREADSYVHRHPDADPALRGRLRLVQATVDLSRGRYERGARTLHEVQLWAVQHDDLYLRARSALVMSVLLRRAGEVTTALEHAVMALDLLPGDAHLAVRVDHMLGLGDSLAMCRSWDDAVARYQEAIPLATEAGDELLRLRAVNNLAYTFYEAERYDEAVALCEEIVEAARASGAEMPLYAMDTLAVTYLAAGRLEEAERVLRAVTIETDTAPDDIAQTMLTLARVRRQRGDLVGADEALSRAAAVALEHDIGEVSVQAQGERAELSAAQGQFERAFVEFKDYHERLLAQHAVERDARARMLHAVFEATEARRESERFRELSYRDPLTKLRNRRFVDETLTREIELCVHGGRPLTVAFLDLDHFKRINDTCSHEVGDVVLARVAATMDRYVDDQQSAFAARMGGEEFLIVLPGLRGERAGALLEAVRTALEGTDWHGITAGLPVTVSIGMSTAPEDGNDRLQVLAAADRRLYLAKAAGRNQVVATG